MRSIRMFALAAALAFGASQALAQFLAPN